jgi:Family of unknown function (DUF6166)
MIDLTAAGAVDNVLGALRVARLYVGVISNGQRVVYADKRKVIPGPSQLVWNHSPDGFNWGYGGSGPAQLALALLLDCGLPAELATRLHQLFKWDEVSSWDNSSNWLFSGTEFMDWLSPALRALACGDLHSRPDPDASE